MINPKLVPLAEQLRPKSLGEVIGQDHLVGKEGFLTRLIYKKTPLSILLWGPPGCGKTSIARLYAKAFDLKFVSMSAVWDGIAELRRIVKESAETPLLNKGGVVLFLDEIHRFNKAQQDALLPFVEDGTLILVGSTVENPSFYLNNALLSRIRVLTLNSLDENSLRLILKRAEEKVGPLPITDEARDYVIALAQGDGRYLINLIENLKVLPTDKIASMEEFENVIQKRGAHFDKAAEQHYNLISALHKSVRGSDPDAALYWLSRMLEGGESPLFIARRLIRMATEDVGLADPQALQLAVAARDSYEMLGSPEGELALAEVAVYLALAPKSNAIYLAYEHAREEARLTTHLPPPKHILNAPTRLMKEIGYGKGYQYDHDTPFGISGQQYFPDDKNPITFYSPVDRGFEREMRKRKQFIESIRRKSNNPQPPEFKLVDILRPKNFDEVIGQDHLAGKEGILRKYVQEGKPRSIFFVGPSGVGKTSLAKLYGNSFKDWRFLEVHGFNRESSKKLLDELAASPQGVILFMDEYSMFSLESLKAFGKYFATGQLKIIGAGISPIFGSIKPFDEMLTLNEIDENAIRTILERAEKILDIPSTVDRQSLINWASLNGNILVTNLTQYKFKS